MIRTPLRSLLLIPQASPVPPPIDGCAFQFNAFQGNAFQVCVPVPPQPVPGEPEGIMITGGVKRRRPFPFEFDRRRLIPGRRLRPLIYTHHGRGRLRLRGRALSAFVHTIETYRYTGRGLLTFRGYARFGFKWGEVEEEMLLGLASAGDTWLQDSREMDALLADPEFWIDLKVAFLKRMEPKLRAVFDEGIAAAQTFDVPGYESRAKDFLDPLPGDLDDIAGQVFRNYVDDWWLLLEETTRDAIREAIINAHREGKGVRQVIKELRPIFGPVRAKRIGVTESTRLFGRGATATYQASGLEGWEWRTVEDGRVCPTCDEMSGEKHVIADEFNPAHVSCRCFPAPVVLM